MKTVVRHKSTAGSNPDLSAGAPFRPVRYPTRHTEITRPLRPQDADSHFSAATLSSCLDRFRSTEWRTSPSIVPRDKDQDAYLVMDDFGGRLARVWRETEADATDSGTVIRDLLDEL